MPGDRGVHTGAPLRFVIRDGRLAALLRFVDGRPLTADDVDTVGSALARVHHELGRCPVPHGIERWPWRWPDDVITEPSLRAAANAAVERARELAPRLTHGILHGDPAPEAFLASGDDAALIDWGAACHGPLLYDVASALMYTDGRVVRAYAAVGPLESDEFDHVDELVAFRWAVQAWYFSDRIARGDLTGISGGPEN